MLEKDLKEIIVVKADAKEVLAVIPNKPQEKEIIQAKDIDIIFNYSDKEREYIGDNGKVFLKDEY